MSTEIKLPELGENVSAGDLVRMLVKAGDTIQKDQPVVELETDKATIEVPSPAAGRITEIRVKEGDKVSVGQAFLWSKMERDHPRRPPRNQQPRPWPRSRPHRPRPSRTAARARAAARREGGPARHPLRRDPVAHRRAGREVGRRRARRSFRPATRARDRGRHHPGSGHRPSRPRHA